MDEQTFRIQDLVGIFRRRFRVMAMVAGAVFLLSILVAAVLPNWFESYTTLLVEPQTISKKLVAGDTDDTDLVNRLHLMTMEILSRARLSRVIDDLHLYSELSDEMTRQEIIEYMRSQVRVEPVLPELDQGMQSRQPIEINTFQLFFRSKSPVVAAAVANRLANDFIDEHIRNRVRSSGDTAEFMESELSRLSTRLHDVEGQIAKIKADNAGSLPEDRMANEGLQSRSLEALRDVQRRLNDDQSDQAFYEQQAKLARLADATRGDVVGQAVTPQLRLQQLEMQLGQLRARGLTDQHPDVVAVQAEMEQLRKRLKDDDSGNAAASPAEQQAVAEAKRAELRADADRQEVARLQKALDDVQARLAATPRVAQQLDALNHEYLSLSENFNNYSNKRVSASVSANMERRQKGEQFRVLETAVPPPSPVSPNRPLIIVIGLLLGLAAGAATGLLLEAADSSYHEARSLQQSLRIPVLAAIPGILLDSDRRARRRRLIRDAMAAAAVAGAVLVSAAAGYVYVNIWSVPRGGQEAEPAATAPAPAAAAAPGAPPAVAPAAPLGGNSG
jgi:succinoglycan biosynthesis transport protein ExoP